jgi:hypothetical protein
MQPGAESPDFARLRAQKCAHKDRLLILKSALYVVYFMLFVLLKTGKNITMRQRDKEDKWL